MTTNFKLLRAGTFICAGLVVGIVVEVFCGPNLFWPAAGGVWLGIALDI
jgi:hypothetical protein